MNEQMIKIDEISIGTIMEGIITGIKPYGAFIKTKDGISGLLNIENISVARLKSPSDRFEVGQNIKVMVKLVEKESNRVFFTHKELLGTWNENIKKYNEGDVITGIVRNTEKNNNGIFIELKPNLVGMIDYTTDINYGDSICVSVKKINFDKQRIKLTKI